MSAQVDPLVTYTDPEIASDRLEHSDNGPTWNPVR